MDTPCKGPPWEDLGHPVFRSPSWRPFHIEVRMKPVAKDHHCCKTVAWSFGLNKVYSYIVIINSTSNSIRSTKAKCLWKCYLWLKTQSHTRLRRQDRVSDYCDDDCLIIWVVIKKRSTVLPCPDRKCCQGKLGGTESHATQPTTVFTTFAAEGLQKVARASFLLCCWVV